MFADLHIHSVYSDGLLSPDEICRLAKKRGLGLISVTDHDTMAGLENKAQAAKRHGLAFVSGWEISAHDKNTKTHVLGYGCQRNAAYEKFMNERKQASFERAEENVKKFRALGLPITLQEVLDARSSPDLPVHTMHVARTAGLYLGMNEGEVYIHYLAKNKPAHSNLGRPNAKAAIECIHAAGGFASLAHPGRIALDREILELAIAEYKDCGLDGIEVYYTTHTEEQTEFFLSLAKKYGLLATGGSDMHVEDGLHASIGTPAFQPSNELLKAFKI